MAVVVIFSIKAMLQYPHYCGKPSHEVKLSVCGVEEILLPNSGVSYFINYVAPCHRR